MRDSLFDGKAVERAQKIAQRVSEPTVVVGGPLDDLLSDPQVVVIVRADDPEPQDIRAVLVHHLLRGHDVAERLRHLAALLIENKAMGQHALVGRTATGGAGLQKRRVEPTAMLVGAFQIQVCRADKVVALLENEGMGRSGIEPDIEDVRHLLIFGRIVIRPEEPGRVRGEPAISALVTHRLDHTVDHRLVAKRLAAGHVDEHRDRHAPGTLAREAPVGTLLDHRGQAALAGRRIKSGAAEFGHSRVAKPVRFHRHEPLRGVAIDKRRFGPPAVRIGMDQLADADDTAMLSHDLGDPRVVTKHMHAGENRQVLHDLAVFGHRVGQRDAVLEMGQFIILDTMAGGDMDKACSLVGGDVIGKQHRHVVVIAMAVHRMQRDRALDVAALKRCQRLGRGDADGRGDVPDKFGGEADHIAVLGQRVFGKAGDPQHRIVDIGTAGHRAVAGHGPGGGRPDDDVRAFKGRVARLLDRKARIDGDRGVVLILDLRLGECRFLDRRPHHRLGAAIKAAIHQDPAELAGDRRLGVIGHGGVGIMPVAENTEPLELLGLDIEPVGGEIAALLAKLLDRNLVLVLALLAVLLLDLPFDGKAVTVPARDIVGILAEH